MIGQGLHANLAVAAKPGHAKTPSGTRRGLRVCAGPGRWADEVATRAKQLADGMVKGAVAASLSLALASSPPPAAEAIPILRFPSSENLEVAHVQQTLIQTWNIVGQTYVDPTFNGHNWMDELRSGMQATSEATDEDGAFESISKMLADLDDPYTRISRPKDFETFRMSTEGQLEGVGMLVASSDGKLIVVAPFKGSPAQKAGILPGDELLSINGKSIGGLNGEQVARLLRGKAGTSVAVRLHRVSQTSSNSIPGVASRPETPVVTMRQVRMRRAAVELSSVYSEALESEQGDTVGYISINNFSQTVAKDTAEAIKSLEAQGATNYILDLRNNGGGLVQSGMEVARLWLDGPATLFHVQGRGEDNIQDVALSDGHSMTSKPLAVLVNKNSASASEILAGALRDHGRAMLVGDTPTFGKGKIQSVYELQDGSALFVTIARYTTPNNHEIDHVGLRPDLSCARPGVMEANLEAPSYADILSAPTSSDSCVRSAEEYFHRDA